MMNRRRFFESTVAGVAAARLVESAGTAVGAPARPMPRAQWLKAGLIDAGGSHEPYSFMVRKGGISADDAYQSYQRSQSEEVILRLKGQGIEVFHTHLYKGFGMALEKPEMDDAKRVAELAHRHGLKVDSYIQWNTMMYETFFAEEPRAQEWIQRDIDGHPILLTYDYLQSYRYRPCFANQEYLEYLKKIVHFAVTEVKTDFIHFDNFDLNSEPESCHCRVCVKSFREFLKAKYTPEQRKKRFGFEVMDFVNPPQWNRDNPPEKMPTIADPGIQEWVDYRCHVMSEALRQMAAYAKSLNPEVAIEVNPHGITGGNRAWQHGLDHARFLKWTESFWTEVESRPGLGADGRVLTRIRSYKLARAFDNILLAYIANQPLAMAECLAFNQTIGFAGNDPLPREMLRYIAFYRKYREFFVGASEAANVAILRSYPSITYNNAVAQLGAVLAEQALIEGGIPFRLVFDEHLAELSPYRVLVLSSAECLSEEQVNLIRRFVENGGGLVMAGRNGIYDEYRRFRRQPGLAELAGVQQSMRGRGFGGGRRGGAGAPPSGPPVRNEYKAGRVVYLQNLDFDGPMPAAQPYFEIGERFWKKPKNWQDFLEGIRWAARGDIPAQASGPSSLVLNVVAQPEKRRLLVHMVNYGVEAGTAVKDLDVGVRLPAGSAVKEIRLLSPDGNVDQTLAPNNKGAEVRFTVPAIQTYAIASVNW